MWEPPDSDKSNKTTNNHFSKSSDSISITFVTPQDYPDSDWSEEEQQASSEFRTNFLKNLKVLEFGSNIHHIENFVEYSGRLSEFDENHPHFELEEFSLGGIKTIDNSFNYFKVPDNFLIIQNDVEKIKNSFNCSQFKQITFETGGVLVPGYDDKNENISSSFYEPID